MSGRKIQVLLVEDNPDHAELLRRNLEAMPTAVQLHQVADGEAALDYLFGRDHYADRANFPLPDVIFLDWRLPRLDGLEVLRQVKSHADTAELPVVVLTTSDASSDLDTAVKLRADKFLTKPAAVEELAKLFLSLGFHSWIEPALGAPQSRISPA
jgi:CheY-like chemotaxis protein